MDGRNCFKWFASACLLAGVVGCGRNAQQSPFNQMPDGEGLPASKNGVKSLWSGTNAPTVHVEKAPEVISNKPATADSIVAFSDVRLDAALDPNAAPGAKEGLLDIAREGYQLALKKEPKNQKAMLGMARFYAKVGEKAEAIEAYKKFLTAYPKEADVAHEVAIAHARWKDWEGACAWCEFTLKMDPENRAAKKTLGLCLARIGQWEKALIELCKIMPEAQARHNLAGMLDHMGHTEESKMQLQLAMKADPNFTAARDFLAELERPQTAATPNVVPQTIDKKLVP